MQSIPPGYSLTIRVRYQNQIGMLARITTAIAEAGGDISALDIVESGGGYVTRDIMVNVRDGAHGQHCVEAMRHVPDLRVLNVSDRVFLLHLGGKLEVRPKTPVRTRDDLMMAYTPGVTRVAEAIRTDPDKIFTLTIKRNAVAVITDGSALLHFGDAGARAALPVMEGRAVVFKEFAGIDAFPLCLETRDPEHFIHTVEAVSPAFGAIYLEDIADTHCFEVERRLQESLDIPVFHGNQHATAIVVLAALINAARLLGRELESFRVAILGAGPGGSASARLLLSVGVSHVVAVDRGGILHPSRRNLTPDRQWLAEHTNSEGLRGDIHVALKGADVFVGVSGRDPITAEDLAAMGPDPIVLALANYNADIVPEGLASAARIIATGRSDLPNQINSMLAFPGFIRGLLDSRTRVVTDEMKIAAARTIASIVEPQELHEEYIVPSLFDRRVVPAVAHSASMIAEERGLSRREPRGVGH